MALVGIELSYGIIAKLKVMKFKVVFDEDIQIFIHQNKILLVDWINRQISPTSKISFA